MALDNAIILVVVKESVFFIGAHRVDEGLELTMLSLRIGIAKILLSC